MTNYALRRKTLLETIDNNSVVFIHSGQPFMQSLDEETHYKVDPNFFYLTGIAESDMILELSKFEGCTSERLFIKKFDPVLAKWIGPRLLSKEATLISGVEVIMDYDLFDDSLQTLYNQHRHDVLNVYLDLYQYRKDALPSQGQLIADKLSRQYYAWQIKDVYVFMAKQRLVKDDTEIANIRQAIEITKKGIESMLTRSCAFVNEMALEGAFMQALMENGCKQVAFETIMASGANATTLHYVKNDDQCKANDLVLCDLGATYNHYRADISRTFPSNGKFTDRQKELYNVVLEGQAKVIDAIKPGVTLSGLNQVLIDYYTQELPKHGLMGPVGQYYYHGVSHMLGLDTHDIDLKKGATPLQKGMVITVEPGLYIAEESIGIRIEDDLLVADKPINLSSDIIKTVEEIEKWMSN